MTTDATRASSAHRLCLRPEGGRRGRLRRACLLLLPILLLAAPAVVRAEEFKVTSGSVTMVSLAGDYIGGGTDRLYDSPGELSISGGLGHVEISVSAGGEWWSFDFAPPKGSQLEVGEYSNAERYPFQAASAAGLSVSGSGRGCNHDYGRFVVEDIHVDSSGNVDRFWALYEQHCESTEAPALFGEVRVGEPPSGAQEAVEPAAIRWPDTPVGAGGVHVPVTVVAGGSGAQITSVAIEGTNAGDFSVSSDECDGASLSAGARCQLAVSTRPTAVGPRVAQLVITDASARRTVVPLVVSALSGSSTPPQSEPSSQQQPSVPTRSSSSGSPPSSNAPLPPVVRIQPKTLHGGLPDLFIEIGAFRVARISRLMRAVFDYRYYFTARSIRCVDGANAVVITLAGTRHFVPCRSSLVLIGRQVTPHKTYTIKVQAVIMRKHKIRKSGASYVNRLYMPGSEAAWIPVSQLPPTV